MLVLGGAFHSAAQSNEALKRPFDELALQRVARVSDPQLSPDGSAVAFVVQKVSLSQNAKESHIWMVPLEESTAGEARRVTFDGESNSRPRWAPDSTRLAFLSDRSGSPQVWMMQADGTGARQVTDLATGAAGLQFAADGEHLVFTSRVFAECGEDDACNARKLEKRENDPVKARLYDSLLYRHWDEWDDGRRTHLFALAADADEAVPVDLTPGALDSPPFSLGGPDGYSIAPDGREICFERKAADRPESSTNVDLWTTPITGGAPRLLTRNPAADVSPLYSPDGRYIAYRAQKRAGYESDRFRLALYDRATRKTTELTQTLDRWVTSISWSPDSSRLFFTAADRGREPIYTVRALGGPAQVAVYGDAQHGDVQLGADGKAMIYAASSGSQPTEIYRARSDGGPPEQITHLNDALLEKFDLSTLEEVTWTAADGTSLSGFLVKPPGFDLAQRYPLLTLVHGGPQGAWGESWSYRWNAQVFASAGFVVFMPNPRGSTGYGQAFTDEIRGDWGGKPFEDIMAGVDHVLARPYVDATRLAVAGGSYGGYMVNWIVGHTDRFKAAMSHAGVYDLRSFFGSTEELWFPLWDLEGAPWEKPEIYETFSPSGSVENFKTPTLVVHGELDYRVPASQGLQMFTALQSREVESRLLYFPDEGHWILKPRNSVYWYRTVLDWLEKHTE